MEKVSEIQKLLQKGDTKAALQNLLVLSKSVSINLSDQVTILYADYSKWEKQDRLGLRPPDSSLRHIQLSMLEVCNEITTHFQNINSTLSDGLVLIQNKHLKLLKRVELLIEINHKSIYRLSVLCSSLIFISVFILFLTHGTNFLGGHYIKEIMSLSALIIICVSGFSLKEINDKRSLLRLFQHFKYSLEDIDGSSKNNEYSEDVKHIQQLFWETSQKMVANL